MAAVEMAAVAGPMFFMLLGIFQFVVYQYTQLILDNKVHNGAAKPETEIYAVSATGYKDRVCREIRIIPLDTCNRTIKIEMAKLADVSTSYTSIRDSGFPTGVTKDVIVLRVEVPVTQFVPFIPILTAKAAVVFRRP